MSINCIDIKEIVTPFEYNFISMMDNKFPDKGVLESFNFFAKIKPSARLKKAEEVINTLPREDWLRIEVPVEDIQTVAEHQNNMKFISDIKDLNYKVKAMSSVNGLVKSIVTDFAPKDNVIKSEKDKLETIAANVIFSIFPYQHRLWQEYEEGKTDEAKLTRDLDKIETINYATYLESKNPQLRESLNELWDYTDKKIITSLARQFYSEAINNRKSLINEGRPISAVYLKLYNKKSI